MEGDSLLKKSFFLVFLVSIFLIGCSNDDAQDVTKQEDISEALYAITEYQRESIEDIKDLNKKVEELNIVVTKQQEIIVQLTKENQKVIVELEIQNRQSHIQEYIDDFTKPIIFDVEDPMNRFYYSKGKVLDGSYNSRDGIESFYEVRTFLRSFEKLTEKTKKYLTKEEIEEIGNLDGMTQTLGLANIPIDIIGALYDQKYIIKKLDFEVAIKKYQDGEIDQETLNNIKEAYFLAKQEYEEFIKKTSYGD